MLSRFILSTIAALALTSVSARAQTPPAAPPSPIATADPTNILAPSLSTLPQQAVTFTAFNQMSFTLAVAVAYAEGSGETARGWQPIPAGACNTMGPFPMNRNRFSFYAMGNGGRTVWAGSSNFCVNTTAPFTNKNAARPASTSLCVDQSAPRAFISITPAMILPNDPAHRDDPSLTFKFNFKQ